MLIKRNPNGTILTVDDDPTMLAIIEDYLVDCGFDVFKANCAQEALKVFPEIKPDVLLLDLYMPEMSGLQLLEVIKTEYPDTPIIVVSAANDINDAIASLRLGAWDYILKPFTQPVIEHTVIKVLEKLRLINENKKIRVELDEKNLKIAHDFEVLKEDQTAGKNVQQLLFPKEHFEFDRYKIACKVIPSLYLSGDFVDYFQINHELVGFYLADVSGHGASSAFITVLLKSLLSQLMVNYQSGRDDMIEHPAMVLKYVSDELLKVNLEKYLTMVYCVLNIKENYIDYSVGGHYPNPLLNDGKTTSILKGSGFAVGVHKDAVYKTFRENLPEKFTLAMLSDGIFEILKANSLNEKEDMLCDLINEPELNMDDVLTKIGVLNKSGFPDDIALLLMTRC